MDEGRGLREEGGWLMEEGRWLMWNINSKQGQETKLNFEDLEDVSF